MIGSADCLNHGRFAMLPLTRIQLLSFAAASTLIAIASGTPAWSDELPTNLGPVAPHEPVLTDVGTKRVIAWFTPDGGGCAVTGVVWTRTDVDGTSTAGMRIRLNPGQIVHFDSAYDVKPLNLKCADDAETLSIVDNEELVAFDIERRNPSMKASASGF
jgi:hypothetical protein